MGSHLQVADTVVASLPWLGSIIPHFSETRIGEKTDFDSVKKATLGVAFMRQVTYRIGQMT
jgi:hypothetical protein